MQLSPHYPLSAAQSIASTRPGITRGSTCNINRRKAFAQKQLECLSNTLQFMILWHLPVSLSHLQQASAWTWNLAAPCTPSTHSPCSIDCQQIKTTLLQYHQITKSLQGSHETKVPIRRGVDVKLRHTLQHLPGWSSLEQQEVMESSLLQQSFHEFCSTASVSL